MPLLQEPIPEPRWKGKHRAPRRPFPLHPLLLAAVPVLSLWLHNVSDGVGAREVIMPLSVVVAASFVVVLVATMLLRRDLLRGALAGSVVVLLVFSYGPLTDLMREVKLLGSAAVPPLVVALSIALCVGAIVAILRAGRGRVTGLTKGLNIVAAGLVAFNLVAIRLDTDKYSSAGTDDTSLLAAESGGTVRAKKPDIYFIVLDEYGGEQALRELLGFDNRPFLKALADRGFYLPPHPTTNYPRTVLYLAATMNMRYVQEQVEPGRPVYGSDLVPLIQHDLVPKLLHTKGYTYINIGSWVEETATNPQADRNVVLGHGLSEFSQALLQQTVVAPALQAVGSPGFDRQQFDRANFQFDQLAKSRSLSGPTFVFAHILMPHWPFVFGAHGEFKDTPVPFSVVKPSFEQIPEEVRNAYVAELQATNTKTLALIDKLLSGPVQSRPVIVLQSDEGFFTQLYGDPQEATDRDLEQHFNTLAAYYFPGLQHTGLYRRMTPVNTFRLLFDDYLGAKFPLLPDRNYVVTNGEYGAAFTDVTARVRSSLR
ncbi:MAG TPA: sulfatase-like hydrolase/transferase [Actinomycetota bacterium]